MDYILEFVQASKTRACDWAMPWIDAFLSPSCAACQAPGVQKPPFCIACALSIEMAQDVHGYRSQESPPWRALWQYEEAVRKLVLLGKENSGCAAAYWLAEQFAEQVGPPQLGRAWAMVPPSRKRRLSGWYLPEVLLSALQSKGHYTNPRLLSRRNQRPGQASQNADERLSNLCGSFTCRAAAPRQVVLVDDVRTTGASLRESARALRAAGARDVRALVLAAPPLRRLE